MHVHEQAARRQPVAFLIQFDATTVADLVKPPIGVFTGDMTVTETVEQLRDLTRAALITYCYITDEAGRLEGVVVMRDLLLATPETRLSEIMLRDPFALDETMKLNDALKAALSRHYPVLSVCDSDRVLKGLIRGDELFAEQAIEISAQAGKMVGVEKEERLATPLQTSLKLRHPWLQINLLTAFVAAAVVGVFEDTLSQLVILAVFLPVMAGQTGNTGCQALAVTLRGMTLGELKPEFVRQLIIKEGILGLCNGILVGITAGAGMVFYAMQQGEAQPCDGPGRRFRDVGELHHRRRFGRAHPADPEADGRRPGDGVEHLPDHGQRRRQHGRLPVARDGAADLEQDGLGPTSLKRGLWPRYVALAAGSTASRRS